MQVPAPATQTQQDPSETGKGGDLRHGRDKSKIKKIKKTQQETGGLDGSGILVEKEEKQKLKHSD